MKEKLIEREGLPNSPIKLMEEIEKQYDPKIGLGEAAANLQTMKQMDGESVRAYAIRLHAEAKRAGLSVQDLMVRQTLIHGLLREKTIERSMKWMTSESAN